MQFELNAGHAYGDYYATPKLSATNPASST
ncbi:hypothetical protein SCARR_04968 [Pontiella sulfatireligans]|uniref:Uncharacterized protein n=1 Tax=Pontiella sulfatireligans TaxID=2750658 RepID=A0A6C2UU60_9BACT|nr:hypothetical protein SCARR_04968 [Pontiella sulfatireligans]